MTSPTPTRELTRERVENYRNWCAARVGSLSGADIGVALCDHYLAPAEREGVANLVAAADFLVIDCRREFARGEWSHVDAVEDALRALAGREGG